MYMQIYIYIYIYIYMYSLSYVGQMLDAATGYATSATYTSVCASAGH